MLGRLRQLVTAAERHGLREVACIDGQPVRIHNLARFYYNARPMESVGARDGGDGDLTGFRLWESAPHLIEYLNVHREVVKDRIVLELGAGTGAVGLAAAACGAQSVVLSDADTTATLEGEHGWEERSRIATLGENVRLNGKITAAVHVQPLRWGDHAQIAAIAAGWPGGFGTIVGSDVLYSPRLYDGLAATIRTLAAYDSRVVLSFPERHGDENAFFDLLAPQFELVGSHVSDAPRPDNKILRLVELRRVSGGHDSGHHE